MSDMEKAKKLLGNRVVEDYNSLTVDSIHKKIVESEKNIGIILSEKANDEELQNVLALKKDLERSYRDAIKFEKTKIKVLLMVLNEKEGKSDYGLSGS